MRVCRAWPPLSLRCWIRLSLPTVRTSISAAFLHGSRFCAPSPAESKAEGSKKGKKGKKDADAGSQQQPQDKGVARAVRRLKAALKLAGTVLAAIAKSEGAGAGSGLAQSKGKLATDAVRTRIQELPTRVYVPLKTEIANVFR